MALSDLELEERLALLTDLGGQISALVDKEEFARGEVLSHMKEVNEHRIIRSGIEVSRHERTTYDPLHISRLEGLVSPEEFESLFRRSVATAAARKLHANSGSAVMSILDGSVKSKTQYIKVSLKLAEERDTSEQDSMAGSAIEQPVVRPQIPVVKLPDKPRSHDSATEPFEYRRNPKKIPAPTLTGDWRDKLNADVPDVFD